MTHASISAEERAALGITDTLIRLSIGLEDVGDLIADLDQALRAAVFWQKVCKMRNHKPFIFLRFVIQVA